MKIRPESKLLEYTATSSYATLQKATEAMCKHKSAQGNIGLTFSLFETNKEKDKGLDSGDWIVDHPDVWSDKPVFSGQVIFYSDYWRIADHKVESEIFTDPTWADIVNEANRQLIDPEVRDTACLFLEGFNEIDSRSDGTRVIEFCWGS